MQIIFTLTFGFHNTSLYMLDWVKNIADLLITSISLKLLDLQKTSLYYLTNIFFLSDGDNLGFRRRELLMFLIPYFWSPLITSIWEEAIQESAILIRNSLIKCDILFCIPLCPVVHLK
jgi:hypothetical protein